MKRTSLLFLFVSLFLFAAPAQESPYLFDSFQESYVQYKDGRRFAVPLNFNLVTGEYVFVDRSDGLEKEFSEPELIAIIQIGTRKFLPTQGKATEIIQAEPKFYVFYTGLKKKAPDKITYGGTTETASVDNYSGLAGKGIISGVEKNSRIVADVHKSYEVQVGKKSRGFYNKRSFLKIFPKKNRTNLDAFIDEHKIDFDSVEQVFELYQYAISL